MKTITFLLTASLFLLFIPKIHAGICEWVGPAMGDWSEPSNWFCGAPPGPGDTVRLTGKSLVLNQAASIQALFLTQNCTIAGTGSLIVTGKIDISQGGSHTFFPKIISNGALEAMMATLKISAQPFIINGTALFKNGLFMMNNGGTVEIAQTGVATFENSNNFYCLNDYIGFLVEGKLVKTGMADMNFESVYSFKNAEIDIQAGSLINYFYQPPFHCVIDSSKINIAEGAFLRIERMLEISHSEIAGLGKVLIGTGICRLSPPNAITAAFEQRGGSFSVSSGTDTLVNYTLLGGSMGGGVLLKGNFVWAKGTALSMEVRGFATITDTTSASLNQKILSGALSLSGGGLYTGNDQLSGTVKIPANAIFSLDANPDANFNADLNISGTLRKLNTATVSVGFVLHNGRIEGIGKIAGIVVASGTTAPGIGTGTGTLTFNGPNFLIQAQHKLEIQISETGGIVSSDLLNLIGRCKLGGKLTLFALGNIPAGDYKIVQASDSLTNAFSQLELPPSWEMIQNPFSIILRKTVSAPVANFSPVSSTCNPFVSFNNASSGDSLAYFWAFQGGEPAFSNEKNPLVYYAVAGDYSVTLTVSNAAGSSSISGSVTILPSSETNLEASICAGETYFFNGQNQTNTGTYQEILTNIFGCDSLVNLQLDVRMLNFSVSQNNTTLAVEAENASFQWLDCAGFSPIPGANAASFTPAGTGSYAVAVAQGACSDTSACFQVLILDTEDLSDMSEIVRMFPNPATDYVHISLPLEASEKAPDALTLYDLRGGQAVRIDNLVLSRWPMRLEVRALPAGAYFVVLGRLGHQTGAGLLLVEK